MWYIYTMEYCSGVKKQKTKNIKQKNQRHHKNNSEWGNPDSERQTWYVFIHTWMLYVKQDIRIIILWFTAPEKHLLVIKLVILLTIIIEPLSSNWWKQLQRSTSKYQESIQRQGRMIICARRGQDHEDETHRTALNL